jgi:hypothetical protein
MVREGMQHRVFEREPLEGAWNVDERSGTVFAKWDRVYFEKDDVGSVRVGKMRIPFQKKVDGDRLELSVGDADDRAHVARGAFVLDGPTLRFDGTCDDQPCALKLTKEFPR